MVEDRCLEVALIPQTSRAREAKTVNECAQLTSAKSITTALLQALHAVVDDDADELFGLAATLQLLEVGSRRKRCRPGRAVSTRILSLDNGDVREGCGVVVESYG